MKIEWVSLYTLISQSGHQGRGPKKTWLKEDFKRIGDFVAEGAIEVGPDGTILLIFKDLGWQVSWRGTYIAEYAGPLFIFPLFYFLSSTPKTFMHK